MRSFGRRGTAAASALAVLVAAGLATVLATPSPAVPAAGRPDGQVRWVTLVTGDRVLLSTAAGRAKVVTVRPSKGREGTRFLRQDERGDSYVIPTDAAPLVAAGRLDRRLFNVSKLVQFGYDDRSRGDVPLMVSYGEEAFAQSAGDRLTMAGGRVARALPSLRGDAVAVEKGKAGAFWAAVAGGQPRALSGGVARIWLDGRVTASLDHSVPQIGAPVAWSAGQTGAGATVAVLDTGIDTDHPDLADAVTTAADFTGSESGTDDLYGHGTHVAGTITGDGTASGGKYRGVAPDAKLLNGKVLNDFGGGSESWIIAGMQWAVEQGADVVNMSLGSPFPGDGAGPLDQALNRLTRESGTLFVVSAGNSGPGDQTIGSPGSADEALTVGAVDKQDALAGFSSRGPRFGDLALKPDITAPGVDIVAPYAEGSLLGSYAEVVDGRYLRLEGTSMAAPHVAGAAAIVAAQRPEWDADELKAALMGSAAPRDGLTVYQQGAGRVDVARAVTQQVFATTHKVDNGIVRWPHTNDEPIVRTVTYRNDGPTAVTLALSVDMCDPNGAAAPAGMFTVDRSSVTVPAAGTASVRLVTDTRVPAPDGTYGGYLTATGGQTTVRTPVGVTREVESYDVALTFLDRAGQATSDYLSRFVDVARLEGLLPYDPSGRVVARLPRGIYYFEAWIQDHDAPGDRADSIVVEPGFAVTGDTDLVVDARQAVPVGTRVDQPDAAFVQAELGFQRATEWGGTGLVVSTGTLDNIFVRPSSTSVPAGEFTFFVDGDLARPDGAGGFADSPYLYHVQWSQAGRVPSDLVRRIHDRDLATVETRIASSGTDQIATKDWSVDVTGPATIVERFTPGVEYRPAVSLRPKNGDPGDLTAVIASGPVVYQLGRTVERWNVGVFGPGFPDTGEPFVARTGDTISAYLPLFADQPREHYGFSATDSMRMALSRDGKPLAEWSAEYGAVDVLAEVGTYRLEATASRGWSELSTQVSAVWTFRSETTDGQRALPLMAVRFAPDLDDHNRAPAGRSFTVPVYVQQQAGAQVGEVRSVTVQVSYDDGRTWSPVIVAGEGSQRTVVLQHPSGGGFVSLQARATDSAGNTVEQTIVRAYSLK